MQKSVMDLGPKNELYERRFNLCVKRLMVDAVRWVRVQFDIPAQGEVAMRDYVPESLQRCEERATESEGALSIQPVWEQGTLRRYRDKTVKAGRTDSS